MSAAHRFDAAPLNTATLHKAQTGERLLVLPAWLFSDWLHALVLGMLLSLGIGLRTYWLRRRRVQHEMRIAVRIGERNRIARELHDSLLQSFHGLMFRLQAARNVLPNSPAEAAEMIDGTLTRGDNAMNEARRAIQQLRGAPDAERDLVQSVAALAQDLQLGCVEVCLPVFSVVESGEARRFDQLIHEDIYCIVREAVRNAFHHAQARHIDVEIHYTDPSFLIYVRDDGIGMSTEVISQKRRIGHWGIQGMKERAASFGGDVAVHSTPGEGTTVSLMVPSKLFTTVSAVRLPWLARARSNFLVQAARSAP
ncbi:sensor histidine kinase [Variovorax sp. HJSM1_2]|uniref:sensor histidine kinase n=1 Tax=Variovorax sp. HJSM1_2 TaxID=3366263 RepID=UPI003BF50225